MAEATGPRRVSAALARAAVTSSGVIASRPVGVAMCTVPVNAYSAAALFT